MTTLLIIFILVLIVAILVLLTSLIRTKSDHDILRRELNNRQQQIEQLRQERFVVQPIRSARALRQLCTECGHPTHPVNSCLGITKEMLNFGMVSVPCRCTYKRV